MTRGASFGCGAPLSCKDRMPEFVWAPQAKRMHQIVRIDLKIYIFSPLLRHPCPHRCRFFLLVLNLGAIPPTNNPGSASAIQAQAGAPGKKTSGAPN